MFAPTDDAHADAVEHALNAHGEQCARLDLSAVTHPISIDPGVHVTVNEMRLETGIAIWWRRTGVVPDSANLTATENRLRAEESEALLLGGLQAIAGHWVDNPWVVQAAEHSMYQLAVARQVGVHTPASLATNDPNAAHDAGADNGRWIAKATSPGIGIAPYADLISPEHLNLLPNCLTLLQQAQPATADLRVVVVGTQAWVWSRPRRRDQAIDWRAEDPTGSAFALVQNHDVAGPSIAITGQMGLSFAVLDWVDTPDVPIFLEVNPSGQWLFLADAEQVVAPALATLLRERTAK